MRKQQSRFPSRHLVHLFFQPLIRFVPASSPEPQAQQPSMQPHEMEEFFSKDLEEPCFDESFVDVFDRGGSLD